MHLSRIVAVALACALPVSIFAASPRVLPDGQLPKDRRLEPLKDLDGYFPFDPPSTPEAWNQRAEQVRRQMRIALGILPEPTLTPLNAVIHGRIDRGDYTVEKVYFESMPGFFVTGNLYRPAKVTGRVPAVLCPHGHWPDGRFMESSDGEVKKAFETKAEKFEAAARSPLQARCVHLARMGMIVFHYDMLGYADSQQISFDIAHKFAKQRPEMNSGENWGLFSPQAESHAQSIMGLQTWNSIRALDFLESLPEVDPKRLAVTGASGGGTQTMMLAALDPRVAAAFPAVMVSTAMQGGCTCENASLLRVGTGNIEIASLFAPKPMAMTAADDWTKEMETKGFPQMKQLWTMLGKPENVALTALTQYPHNYNAPSRAAMYAWFNRHLGLNLPADHLEERDFQRLTKAEMSVWDNDHPAPEGGPEFEKKLLASWTDDTQRKVETMPQEDLRAAWQTLIGWNAPASLRLESEREGTVSGDLEGRGFLQVNPARSTALPELAIDPATPNGWEIIWLDRRGKAGLFREGADHLLPEVAALVRQGTRIIGVDLFGQGEFTADGAPLQAAPKVKNPREAAAYTFGYNPSVAAWRIQDIADVLHRLQQGGRSKIGVVAMDSESSALALAAAAIKPVDALVVMPSNFRFGDVNSLQHPMFLPASARFGDVDVLWKLSQSLPMFFMQNGEGAAKQPIEAKDKGDRAAAMTWLMEKVGNGKQ